MNVRPRRNFLKHLLALPLLGVPTAASTSPATAREFDLSIFPIAGFGYYDGPRLLDRLQQDVPLQLVLEPDNPHDQRAVRIEAFGRHIGYVPRSDNGPINRLLIQDAPVEARVFTAGPRVPTLDTVMVAVAIRQGHLS